MFKAFVPLGLISKIPNFHPACSVPVPCSLCLLVTNPQAHFNSPSLHVFDPTFLFPLKDLTAAEFLHLAPGSAGAVKPKLDLLETPFVSGYKGLAIRAPGT